MQRIIAYVDGSFNAVTNTYGAGAVVFAETDPDDLIPLSASGNDPRFAKSRNVAGEVLAASLVIDACKNLDSLDELIIYHDYVGLKFWATGAWKANTIIARDYVDLVSDVPFKLTFEKVKAHSGDKFNDMADSLAKQACGLA